jgi:LuxR family maltose regulon positive regulatory protein
LHRGDVGQARNYVTRATHLRPLLTYALPVVSVQALLELARVYIALTDPNGARTVLTQVHDILQQRPDLGVLSAEAAQLRANVDTMREMTMGASSLTTAELRLLPLLATHLSFRQIGERLYLSQHTVKSQALSVYRKLGVSSRNEAIERAHGFGVLATTSPVVGSRTRKGPTRDRPRSQRR